MAEAYPDRARGYGSRGPSAFAAHGCVALGSPASVRLQPGGSIASAATDGGDRPGSGRVDGHRHADFGIVDAVEAPLYLFQAGFRAGNQSADRPDPRGIGHEPRVLYRAAPQ